MLKNSGPQKVSIINVLHIYKDEGFYNKVKIFKKSLNFKLFAMNKFSPRCIRGGLRDSQNRFKIANF